MFDNFNFEKDLSAELLQLLELLYEFRSIFWV